MAVTGRALKEGPSEEMAAEQQKSECDEEGGTEIAGGRTSR